MYSGKTVLLGITGGIAAYKMGYVASGLVKKNTNVEVMMTKNACEFISPMTFEALTKNKCHTDLFDGEDGGKIMHINLAKNADVILIAPATANVIAKLANGIADDLLTTTVLAATCHKIIAPAMNVNMFKNQVTQDNINKLRDYGWEIVEPVDGYLACGDVGTGKMQEPDVLMGHIERVIAREKDMTGMKVLVTAGATREALDPVRFITNHSSGKMGFAVAKEAILRGADVTLIKAFTTAEVPPFVKVIDVESAYDMFNAVKDIAEDMDIIVKAAAVADYTPESVSTEKVKKRDGDLSIPLKRTTDILAYLGEHKRKGQFLCGFSMETENLIENSSKKLEKKNADMIVANNLKEEGSGFGTDTNKVTFITKDGAFPQELATKEMVAKAIFDRILGK
ncbi:MAG: bifunctional phosphopantothenoylcysteine decarboxylase/phosphopantothenate--cysteine ligase CoaBC [Firmicutes bacterium]|nr:bifunctional phosphopantothenoylcysteine decarboxylase/phosphopantothenate--cysteine ligase CoaBC [Bacillota bacterium]